VAERPYDVYQWLQRHSPPGFAKGEIGFGTNQGVHLWDVEQQLRVQPPNISYADLEQGVTGPKSGPAFIRVDAVVGWTAPRPADELVGSRDRVVTVSGVHTSEPGTPVGRHVTTTDPKLVLPIVRAFNALHVAPPNQVFHCPTIGPRSIS